MSSEQFPVDSKTTSRWSLDLSGLEVKLSWDLVRQEIFPVVWALMDVALLTPFVLSIMRWTRFWPPSQVALLLLLLMLLPYNLIRLMDGLSWPKQRQRRILTAVLLLLLFLSIRGLLHGFGNLFDFSWLTQLYSNLGQSEGNLWLRDLGIFVLVIYTWGRGLALVERQPNINKIGLKMRLGALLLTPLIIWLATVRLLWSMAPFVLLYFLATLTAVALVRAEQIEQERSGLSASLSIGWFSVILSATLLLVLTAGLFALLLSGNTPAVIVAWLAPVWGAVYQLATVAFVAFSYLAFPIFEGIFVVMQGIAVVIRWLAAPIMAFWRSSSQDSAPLAPAPPVLTFNDFVELTNQLNPAVKLSLLLIPIAVVVLLSLFIGRFNRRQTAERTSQRAKAQQEVVFADELSLGQRLLNRLGLLRNLQTAVSIRRIYAQMCRAAAGAGVPRSTTETPYEFLRSLAQVWPDNQADAELVTQAYVRVRYGEVPESKDELAAIRAAWQRLKHTPPATTGETGANLPQLRKSLKE